tara:strand:+ start:4267 stop:6186 length:1920 start_codon:yes stop_codon:yes gene_type:complete
MPLQKLQFRPGINKETTSYTNEGGWFDCDKVRFRAGLPEKIGGWSRMGNNSFLGAGRSLHPWSSLSLENYLGLGTNSKYYIESGQAYYDITPIRQTTAAGDVTFSASSGSSVLTITDTNHGAGPGDFVTYSGAVSLGGTVTAAVLNQEYEVDTVVDGSEYTIKARAPDLLGAITVDGQYSPTLVTATGSDTGDGGTSVVGVYQVNIGLNTTVFGTGWGAGTWSRGSWGSAAVLTVANLLRVWTQDNFGQDLVYNVEDGGIYYWSGGGASPLETRGVALSDLAGASGAPTVARKVIVSDVDRHVIAFGADPINNVGTQDPLLIRFSTQENPADWTPTPLNTAGDLRLGSGSRIVTAVETRQQMLVFTDVSVHAMQYIGPPFTFGINMISENTTVRSGASVIAVDDAVFWMGKNEFYSYSGGIQKMPCSVRDYVFSDFNVSQAEKVFAASNTAFSEVWWFYPSSSSDSVDRYVVYNYVQKIWYNGTLDRTAWTDRGVTDFPIAASNDGYLYTHETGFDDGSTNPPSSINSFVESSQFDIGEGDQFMFVNRIIPDLTFRNSTTANPTVNFTIKTRNFPGGAYLQENSKVVEKTASVPVEQFTQDAHIRLRGRSVAIKVENDTTGVGWRLGSPRLDIRPDGRK